ncbi:MAG: asparagine synthase (glutamine-hydrolyzing) [Chlamydiales bacterium]|jgi:asparagine synthase (glutamine-hydrolysing)
MCGFTGFALAAHEGQPGADAQVDSARLATMTLSLEHRGPDDQGLLARYPFGLGFRRLSIIDLAGGHQPITNEDGNVAVCCNGEIYNFRELRRDLEARGHRFKTNSDAETLVHLYEEYGAAAPEKLAGMFAFCILDWRRPEAPRVLLGRDRLGVKPLFYGMVDGDLYWASEPKALLASGVFAREMRGHSLLDYLVQGYVSGPDSAWNGIQRLAPATTLSWSPADAGEVQLRRYWDLPTDGLRGPAPDDEVLELLDEVVNERLVADVPLGAFLSGGIDSTAVATSMADALSDPLVACSVGFHEKSHDELGLARATAIRLGAVHHTEVLEPDPTLAIETLPWFFDEPHADPSNVPTYLVSRMAREHVTVALSGDGGDEIFGGYRRYVHDVAENRVRSAIGGAGRQLAAFGGRVYPKLDWAPRFLRARTFLANIGQDPASAYWHSVSQLSRSDVLDLLNPDLRASLAEHDPLQAFREHYERPRNVDALYRAQYADFHTNLPDRILSKVDRASMAVALEVRVPLLDHRFVERFANLPTAEKVRGARGKVRLREALRGRLPGEVLDGQKRGFDTPLRAWIRGPLEAPVRAAIESLPEDWFARGALRARLAEHVGGGRDHSRLLWSLLVLEHWRQRHEVKGLSA